jgi:hypothetical protein
LPGDLEDVLDLIRRSFRGVDGTAPSVKPGLVVVECQS